MRPPERRDSGQHDLLRSRLDQIIDLAHPLAKLGRRIDWGFLEQRLGVAYTDRPGRPPLPTRLMAGIAILKHMHNLSDEALCMCLRIAIPAISRVSNGGQPGRSCRPRRDICRKFQSMRRPGFASGCARSMI